MVKADDAMHGFIGSAVLRRWVAVWVALALALVGVIVPSSAFAAGTGDDYPSHLKVAAPDSKVDPWSFYNRECTSFAAWRLNQQAGRTSAPWAFVNNMKGPNGRSVHFGHAYEWEPAARAGGWTVNDKPAVGSVAWWPKTPDTPYGHVAIVTMVNGNGTVDIEEYNRWPKTFAYGTRKGVRASKYLHIADQKIDQAFAKAPAPSITGAPFVGMTLTANPGTWSPSPTLSYQWLRGSTKISGATGKTYVLTPEDTGAALKVTVTAKKSGYKTTSKTSSGSWPILPIDANGNSIGDTQEAMPWNSDVNGDGLPDIVGFASDGIHVALNTGRGFGPSGRWIAEFGDNHGWTMHGYSRALTDVNGDGKSDAVLFANDGVYVALSTGSSFSRSTRWINDFGLKAGQPGIGWQTSRHVRSLGDVNGDGLPDIVGLGEEGVWVALNMGSSFSSAKKWSTDFGWNNGWRVDRHPRYLADMNGDGKTDVVGFGNGGVVVALSTGSGFTPSSVWAQDFGYANGGWRVHLHPRYIVDVNADGLPDVVGFPSMGVYVALNTGMGLSAGAIWYPEFATNAGGWSVDKNPRTLADVNGDGFPDIVGFGAAGTWAALGTGRGFVSSPEWSTPTYSYGDGGWRLEKHPRFVADLNGDGKADLLGFGESGVVVTYSTDSGFGPKQPAYSGSMFTYAGTWRVETHTRAVGIQTMSKTPAPTIDGVAVVGQTITAKTGVWQPAPILLSYQWYRDGVAIQGATGAEYVLAEDDAGTSLWVQVTGRKLGYASVTRFSEQLRIQLGSLVSSSPSISGTPEIGNTLTVETGEWSEGIVFAYQWFRDGVAIDGATGAQHVLTASDVNASVNVQVTGQKPGFASVMRASEQLVIQPGSLVSSSPSISGTPEIGESLVAETGEWSEGVTFAYQWLRDDTAIVGATEAFYTLTADDAGTRIALEVTGSKPGYSSIARLSGEILIEPIEVEPPAPLPLSETPIPEVTGTAQVGKELTVLPGIWEPAEVNLAYQWLRDGAVIEGATKPNYILTPADKDKTVSVKVTGSKEGYESASVVSEPTSAVIAGALSSTPTPSLSGTAQVGKTLAAKPGSWGPSPVVLKYQWLRDGKSISGATKSTYVLAWPDKGKKVSVRVTGSRDGYSPVSKTSRMTGAVKAGALSATPTPKISGTAKVGKKLTVKPGTWKPATVTLKYQWLRNGKVIKGATKSSYSLVKADKGRKITVKVTGSKSGYATVTKTSKATSKVK